MRSAVLFRLRQAQAQAEERELPSRRPQPDGRALREQRRATPEEARAAVQASALQQVEEIEAVLAETAELRAENVRLAEGAIVKKAGGGPKLAEVFADSSRGGRGG